MGTSMTFQQVNAFLFEGFAFTVGIFFLTLLFALPLGLFIAFCSMSKFKPLKYLTDIIVWIVRGVPLMLQIFVIYYVPGFLGKNIFASVDTFFTLNYDMDNMGAFIAVIIAFAINYACYFSVIFRGGIQSIPRGQYEAAQVLGMTKVQTFKHIILPQVIKNILPPMSNEVITLVKDTALANVIMVAELIFKAKELMSYAIIWPMFYTAVFYLVFVGILTLLFNFIEKKLSYYKV